MAGFKNWIKKLHRLFDYQMFTVDDLCTPIYSKPIILQVPNFILIHIEIFTIKTYTYFQGTFCLSVLEIFSPESEH